VNPSKTPIWSSIAIVNELLRCVIRNFRPILCIAPCALHPEAVRPQESKLSKFRLVIQARRKPAGTFTYVITRSDRPSASKMGPAAFNSLDEAAEAGRLAIERLDRPMHP
jgi:hypothetical protein